MKHQIKRKEFIGNQIYQVLVQLIPENLTEKEAVKNIYNCNASDSERESIETYLHFNLNLGNYSIVNSEQISLNEILLSVILN
jgi:hypothetical protein